MLSLVRQADLHDVHCGAAGALLDLWMGCCPCVLPSLHNSLPMGDSHCADVYDSHAINFGGVSDVDSDQAGQPRHGKQA